MQRITAKQVSNQTTTKRTRHEDKLFGSLNNQLKVTIKEVHKDIRDAKKQHIKKQT